jgi:hypothetical protein
MKNKKSMKFFVNSCINKLETMLISLCAKTLKRKQTNNSLPCIISNFGFELR